MVAARKVNAARFTIRWPMRIGLPVPPARQAIVRRRAPRVLRVIAVRLGLRVIAVRLGLRVIAVRRGLRVIAVRRGPKASMAANAGSPAATALAGRDLQLAKHNY